MCGAADSGYQQDIRCDEKLDHFFEQVKHDQHATFDVYTFDDHRTVCTGVFLSDTGCHIQLY